MDSEKWKSWIKGALSIIFLLVLIEYFGANGILGFAGIIILFALYKIIIGWNNYVSAIRSVESQIFSKPLDKMYWPDDEFKNTKFRFVWKKGQEESKMWLWLKQMLGLLFFEIASAVGYILIFGRFDNVGFVLMMIIAGFFMTNYNQMVISNKIMDAIEGEKNGIFKGAACPETKETVDLDKGSED